MATYLRRPIVTCAIRVLAVRMRAWGSHENTQTRPCPAPCLARMVKHDLLPRGASVFFHCADIIVTSSARGNLGTGGAACRRCCRRRHGLLVLAAALFPPPEVTAPILQNGNIFTPAHRFLRDSSFGRSRACLGLSREHANPTLPRTLSRAHGEARFVATDEGVEHLCFFIAPTSS